MDDDADEWAAARWQHLAQSVCSAVWRGADRTVLGKLYGEAAFDLPAPTSNSNGVFTYASSNAAVATLSGRTVTIVGAGQTTITATQAATTNYAAATVSLVLTVDDRPDPTKDAEVAGGLQAQVDAAVRFASDQQANIHDRLRQLRSGRNTSSNNVSFSLTGSGRGPGLSLNAKDAVGNGPAMPQGWGLWSAGVISLGERDPTTASRGFDWRSDGVSVGVDKLIGEDFVLGVAGGFGWNSTDFANSVSEQDTKQQSVSVYGLWRGGGHLFVDALLGYGRLDFDLKRWSDITNTAANAPRNGSQQFGALTFGYEQRAERSSWATYGRYDIGRTTLDAYRESGLGIYDLVYREQDMDNSTLALGVENRYSFKHGNSMLRPYWKAEYRQALENRSDAAMNYVVLPRSTDYLLGLRSYNDDVLTLGAGLDIDFRSGWGLSLQLQREQGSRTTANSFGLRLSYGAGGGNAAANAFMPQVRMQGGSYDAPQR